MNEETIIDSLTQEQKDLILKRWNENSKNPPSLKELVQLIFGEGIDGRDYRAKLIKDFLATRNFRAKASSDKDTKIDKIVLTEEDKLYICNNISTNTSVEIARILFNNNNLTNLNAETRVVNDFVKSLDTKIIYGGKESINIVPDGEYFPPKTLDKALKKINEYVNFANSSVGNLNNQQKKCVEKLIEYLHTYGFIRLVNTYDAQNDRKTCEDAFIRYTYDKPDLTQEEIDQYVELSNHIVQGFKIQKRSETLQKQLEKITDNDADSQKYSMGLVEAIGKASTEYHQCMDRRKKLLEALTQKRSARLDSNIKDNASILNLVEMWRNEEGRLELLKIAELEQKSIADEVDRISSVSEIKLKIMGISKNAILNG